MVSNGFEIENFYCKNMKMKALLVHQGLVKDLNGVEPVVPVKATEKEVAYSKDNWKNVTEKAHRAIILSLGDKVLREISKEST